MANNDTERKTTSAAYAPKRLSFWYRHGIVPHHLRGLGLILTRMLWEQSLTPAEIDRTLREKRSRSTRIGCKTPSRALPGAAC
jgi:hypothetical protein